MGRGIDIGASVIESGSGWKRCGEGVSNGHGEIVAGNGVSPIR